jgi:hypothetical protein
MPAVASAMPSGLATAKPAVQTSNIDQVRWVCNAWGRCWWRPGYRVYGFYGPRYYYGPRWHYGWHRGWHHRHWHHW